MCVLVSVCPTFLNHRLIQDVRSVGVFDCLPEPEKYKNHYDLLNSTTSKINQKVVSFTRIQSKKINKIKSSTTHLKEAKKNRL